MFVRVAMEVLPGYPSTMKLAVSLEGDSELDLTLPALAPPAWGAILERLKHGEARVTELAEPFAMSLAAVSKHIQLLKRAHRVRR